MEFRGRFSNAVRDLKDNGILVTFSVDSFPLSNLDKLQDKTLSIKTTEKKNKRSLDANAYYWQLLTQLADKLGYSKPYLHNLMLRRYGRPMIIDGSMLYIVLPDSDAGEREAEESETYHIKPTSEVKEGKNGSYRTYIMLRGSSTYDTKEMSVLIDGLVQECKEQGIDTLPPEELDRMMQAYDQTWRKKHEVDDTE